MVALRGTIVAVAPARIPICELCGYEYRKSAPPAVGPVGPIIRQLMSGDMDVNGKYYNVRIISPIPFDIGFLPAYN